MILILLRHGETLENMNRLVQGRKNNKLSILGKKQASIACLNLKADFKRIDLFFSSPLKRAYDTLNIIKDSLCYKTGKIKKSRNLIERDFGVYENKSVDSVDYFKKPEKGRYETNEKLEKRVNSFIFKLFKKYPDKTIIIASHSHTIKAFLVKNLGMDYHDKIKNCEYFIIDYKSEDEIKFVKRVAVNI